MAKKKETLTLTPNPDKVLIRIPKADWNSLFSKWVKTDDGQEVELFTDQEEEAGYEKRFTQNVSVGVVVAVGENVKEVLQGDMAIIDYAVTGNEDALVGFVNGERLVCINFFTTYHDKDSVPQMNGRLTYAKGDYDQVSPLLGVVRRGKVIPFSPYVFLEHENATKIHKGSKEGLMFEETEELCERKVLAAPEGNVCKGGDKVKLKEADIFDRTINNKKLSVIFKNDIMMVL